MDYKGIGTRIRRERKRKDMTQAHMARKAGISLSFYGHIERGTRVMSVETLVKICEALNADAHYLLWGSNRPGYQSRSSVNTHDKIVITSFLTGLLQNLDVASSSGEEIRRNLP